MRGIVSNQGKLGMHERQRGDKSSEGQREMGREKQKAETGKRAEHLDIFPNMDNQPIQGLNREIKRQFRGWIDCNPSVELIRPVVLGVPSGAWNFAERREGYTVYALVSITE
jgi:hypothetical protein